MNLNFSPVWLILPLGLAVFYAYWFYSKGPQFPRYIHILLAFLRGILILLIGIILLDPSLRWIKEEEEKPLILFLQDNSESVVMNNSSSYYRGQYKQDVQNLLSDISNKYEVRSYSFGQDYKEGIPLNFTDQATNMTPLIERIKDRFEGRNIGAIILASDGIFNRGENPESELLKFHVPIYSIGLGDTSSQKDLILNQVEFNEVVFAGDYFPIQASVTAHNLLGKEAIIHLKQGNRVLETKKVRIREEDAHFFVPFSQREPGSGNFLYTVELEALPGEKNLQNNTKTFMIHVLKSQQNILVLSSIVHPDLSAIKQALSSSSHNKISLHLINDKDIGDLNQYSCLIEYQIPSINGEKIDPSLEKKLEKLPILRILGEQSRSFRLDESLGNIPFLGRNMVSGNRVDRIQKDFQYFSLNDSLIQMVPGFPPLECPYSINQGFSPDKVLAYSVLAGSQDQDKKPLILMDDRSEKKNALILGEGLWKWRTFEFAKTGRHNLVDEFLQKIISFLTVIEDKTRFRIINPKSVWEENESIGLEAELYNQNFELIHNAPIRMELKNQGGKIFQYSFTPEGEKYSLKIGSLPRGTYTYKARVIGTRVSDSVKTGILQVEPSSLELITTQANFTEMKEIANRSKGQFFNTVSLKNLSEKILENPNIHFILREKRGFTSWISLPILLAALLVLLSLEWVLRKWNGFY